MKGYIQIAQKSTADIQNRKALNSGWLLLLITIIFLPQWQHFDSLINNTIAPDLLLRTIGSRLQTAEMPMYQYQWQQGDPVEWLNLYPDLRVGLNGVISTPFTLWLLKPISTLNYCDLKIIWSYLQEFFLFASVWLSCKIFQKLINQIVFLILASIFFIYDTKWLLHLYNGQIYIVYTFFFSLTGYLIFNRNMHKARRQSRGVRSDLPASGVPSIGCRKLIGMDSTCSSRSEKAISTRSLCDSPMPTMQPEQSSIPALRTACRVSLRSW